MRRVPAKRAADRDAMQFRESKVGACELRREPCVTAFRDPRRRSGNRQARHRDSARCVPPWKRRRIIGAASLAIRGSFGGPDGTHLLSAAAASHLNRASQVSKSRAIRWRFVAIPPVKPAARTRRGLVFSIQARRLFFNQVDRSRQEPGSDWSCAAENKHDFPSSSARLQLGVPALGR